MAAWIPTLINAGVQIAMKTTGPKGGSFTWSVLSPVITNTVSNGIQSGSIGSWTSVAYILLGLASGPIYSKIKALLQQKDTIDKQYEVAKQNHETASAAYAAFLKELERFRKQSDELLKAEREKFKDQTMQARQQHEQQLETQRQRHEQRLDEGKQQHEQRIEQAQQQLEVVALLSAQHEKQSRTTVQSLLLTVGRPGLSNGLSGSESKSDNSWKRRTLG